eukprot:2811774-Rhodomonas_salina.3
MDQSSNRIIPITEPMSKEWHNLLTIVSITMLLLWFCHLVRKIFRLYELQNAILNNQVVELAADGTPFGEVQMLWNTGMQQQLLRRRVAAPSLPVQQLYVPFILDKSSLTFHASPEEGLLAVDFNYKATRPASVQLYWNVKVLPCLSLTHLPKKLALTTIWTALTRRGRTGVGAAKYVLSAE